MADVRHVEFDVDLDKPDYKNLVYNNVMGKNHFAIFGMCGMLIISIAYLIMGAVGVIEMTNLLKLLAAAFIVLVLGVFALMKHITNKLHKSDFNFMGAKRHMIINEEHVVSEATDEEKSKEFEWEDLYNADECKTHFLMFSRNGMIILLPKRFMSDEQIPHVRKILKVMMQNNFKTKYKIV